MVRLQGWRDIDDNRLVSSTSRWIIPVKNNLNTQSGVESLITSGASLRFIRTAPPEKLLAPLLPCCCGTHDGVAGVRRRRRHLHLRSPSHYLLLRCISPNHNRISVAFQFHHFPDDVLFPLYDEMKLQYSFFFS
jgi:hypothetical protein